MKTSWKNIRSLALATFLAGFAVVNFGCAANQSSTAAATPVNTGVVGTIPPGGVGGVPVGGGVGGGVIVPWGGGVAVGDWGLYPDVRLQLAFSPYGAGVVATGSLLLFSDLCGYPPGTYPIQTVQPGYVSGNTVYNMSLSAAGIPIIIGDATVDTNMRISTYDGAISVGLCGPGMYFY